MSLKALRSQCESISKKFRASHADPPNSVKMLSEMLALSLSPRAFIEGLQAAE